MKKIFTLLLAVAGVVSTASATKVFFKPNSDWLTANAGFAVCQQKSDGGDISWTALSDQDGDGIYYAFVTVDENCGKFWFIRTNANGAVGWGNKWNQVLAEKPSQHTYYELKASTWDNSDNTNSLDTKTIYDSWVVVGSRHITNDYAEWNVTSASNTMTSDNNGLVYTLAVTGKALKAGTYSYKFYRGDGAWIGNGDNNLTLTIENDGVYDLAFTYDQISSTQNVVATSTGSGTVEYKYYVKEENNAITGNEWTANPMAISGDNATLTVDKALVGGTTYKFKIVEEVYLDGIKKNEYEASKPNTEDGYWSFTPSTSTTYAVTFNHYIPSDFDFTTENVYVTTALVSNAYYFVLSEVSGTWTIGEMLTQSNGVYSGTISNWATKWFAIAPASALSTTGISTWSAVIRPADKNGDYNFDLYFENYADRSTYSGETGYVWYVSAGNGADITMTYDPTNNKWSADQSFKRTINSASTDGYATFSYPFAVKIPAGLTAYYGKTVNSANAVVMAPITDANNEVYAGDGILLKGIAGTSYTFTPASNAPATIENNLLKGNPSNNDFYVPASTSTDFYYVYGKDAAGLGFYKVVSADVVKCPAGSAYLQTTTELAANSSRATIVFLGDEASNINDMQTTTKGTNGYYDLQGRHVAQPTKGLYIVNGKKVIMK